MLRKINQIDHPYLPLLNGVRLLSPEETCRQATASSALYAPETIAALRPVVPTTSNFRARQIAREERQILITDRLWAMYG